MFIFNLAGFNTTGVICLDWIEAHKIKSLPPEYIKNSHEVVRLNQAYIKSLKSPSNQYGSKIITYSNKLQSSSMNDKTMPYGEAGEILPSQSSSAEQSESLLLTFENSKMKQPSGEANQKKLGTPDILQSSGVYCISSADTAEGTILTPIPTCTPSAVTPFYKENRIIKN